MSNFHLCEAAAFVVVVVVVFVLFSFAFFGREGGRSCYATI